MLRARAGGRCGPTFCVHVGPTKGESSFQGLRRACAGRVPGHTRRAEVILEFDERARIQERKGEGRKTWYFDLF